MAWLGCDGGSCLTPLYLSLVVGNIGWVQQWEVEFTDEFHSWWLDLSGDQQEALTARVQLLQQHGPNLGRPSVDSIAGSRHHNMKELRSSSDGHLRVLFAFDPHRTAILLLGGNKADDDQTTPNWNAWYERYVPVADDLYDDHLASVAQEQTEQRDP